MDIGILSVRDKGYHPNQRLIEAASQSGHGVRLIHTRDCLSEIDHNLPALKIQGSDRPDILLPRIGATINDYALGVVRHFELSGVPVVNGFHAILLARNKFLTLQTLASNGISVPGTYLVVNFPGFEEAVEGLGGYPVVAKMPSSRQGSGVALVDSPVTAEFVMHNLQDNSRGLLVQEYIAPRRRREIRAFVIGDRVTGAMELIPNPNDFRSNIHLAGQGKGVTLDPKLSDLAVRSAKVLGLEIAGTDIIVGEDGAPRVIEVNYSPGFRGLEKATELDIASEIIRYVEDKFRGTS
jgi:ribosomal protein S6--L-glutamate ligase